MPNVQYLVPCATMWTGRGRYPAIKSLVASSGC